MCEMSVDSQGLSVKNFAISSDRRILSLADVEDADVDRYLTAGRHPEPVFKPFFCVLRQDLKTLQCCRTEQVWKCL